MELNSRQQEAVNWESGPVLIAAGAGSGKTKTLTARLAKLIEKGVPPESILAVTFTNKAAEEMKKRVANNQELETRNQKEPFIGTFHSLGAKILKKEAHLLKRTSNFSIFDDGDSLSLVKEAIKSLDFSSERYKPAVFASQISKIKNLLLDPEEFLDANGFKIFQRYEELMAKNNAFDFEDLIEKVVRLFERGEILEKYQNKFKGAG